MLKKVVDLISFEGKGLNTNPNIFTVTKDQSPNMMNIRVEHDGSKMKRLGTVTMNTVVIADSAAAGFSPTGSITNNLIAFWKMDEASGNRMDSFGGHTLLDNNSVLQASGIKNQAGLYVASNSEYLLHANTSTLATGDVEFGMSAWFYLNSTSTSLERSLISKRDDSKDIDICLLLHCDGSDASTTFTDNSLSSKSVTANGNAQVDTAQSKFGTGSCLLDGSGDYLSILDSPDWDFGTGDFTIDFWFRPSAFDNGSSYTFFDRNTQGDFSLRRRTTNTVAFYAEGVELDFDYTWTPDTNQWYHVAVTRNGTNLRLFINGVNVGNTLTSSNDIQGTADLEIGRANSNTEYLNGWIDEFRIIKGRAVWTDNFTPPILAYSNPSNPSQYEYYLYINTDNILTFRVSNSGTGGDVTVRATSFGAVTTSTWYNAVAYHTASNNHVAVGINLSMNSSAYTTGVRSGSAPFVIGSISNGASAFFDGRIDEVGFWKKHLNTQDRILIYNSGNSNTWQTAFTQDPWASFDFGAGANRWLTVAAGTGIYASSNLGVTWVTIATDRTANYQYFERSKNILVSGSDSYDTPLLWAGSAGTFATILNPSAPLVKYWINHQGFLIGLNKSGAKRGFYWEDENTQVTGDWGDSFDIPSSADDEITAGFILRRRLYVSTRYFLYGLDYVGGNPDWSYRKIKDFGFVPRTVKVLSVEGIGEVALGMDQGNKLRIFDGADDKIISSIIEFDNRVCEFALDKVSNAGSGKVVSFAEVERNEQYYRICLAIGKNSSQTTHFLNFNPRNSSFWPDDNRPFNTMCSAESNQTSYMMAFDRSGRCHMLDSGNKDAGVTPIQDVYDSAYIFDKSPSQAQKNHNLDLYFLNTTAGRIYVKESVNFDKTFKDRDSFVISGTGNKVVIHKPVDVPSESNSYQYRITTSGGTQDPWILIRHDFFTEGLGIGKTEDNP